MAQSTSCLRRTRYASTSATAPKSAAGNRVADFGALVERARERDVLDDRHAVLARDLADARGHEVLALGDDDAAPTISVAAVLERDGEVGRVGDDDGRAS